MTPGYTIDGIPECTTPVRDERGMWRAVHEPSGRLIESYSWERLVIKALRAKLSHVARRAG